MLIRRERGRCSTLLSHTALMSRPAVTCLPVLLRTATSTSCGCLRTPGSGNEGCSRLIVREHRRLTSSASSPIHTGWPPEETMASWLSGTSVKKLWWPMRGSVGAAQGNLKPERRQVSQGQGSDKKQTQQMSEEAEAGGGKTLPKLSFNHGEKVNWVCPAVLKGKPSLLVTDQTSSPSVYSLDEL